MIRGETSRSTYQVWVTNDITDQDLVDQNLRKALARSREQFNLSRRMSLARKPEAVLKTLMSAAEFRTAENAVVLFFEYPARGPSHEIEVITSWVSDATLASPNQKEAMTEFSFFEDIASTDLFHPSKPVILT